MRMHKWLLKDIFRQAFAYRAFKLCCPGDHGENQNSFELARLFLTAEYKVATRMWPNVFVNV